MQIVIVDKIFINPRTTGMHWFLFRKRTMKPTLAVRIKLMEQQWSLKWCQEFSSLLSYELCTILLGCTKVCSAGNVIFNGSSKNFFRHHKKVELVEFIQRGKHLVSHQTSLFLKSDDVLHSGCSGSHKCFIPLTVGLLSLSGEGFITKWWHKSPHLSELCLTEYYYMCISSTSDCFYF